MLKSIEVKVDKQNNKYYVYFHSLTSSGLINDIFYVGKGCKNRSSTFNHRNKYWHNKVNKNGGFFINHIATELTEKEAFDIEKFYISVFGKWQDNGLLVNMTDGGDGVLGYIPSDEHKQKISNALKGRIGKPLTKEAKLKISLAKTGVKQDPNVIKRRSEKLIGKYRNTGYSVDVYDLYGNFISNFKCVTELVKDLNLKSIRGNIFGCLNGVRKTAGGYIFKKNVN